MTAPDRPTPEVRAIPDEWVEAAGRAFWKATEEGARGTDPLLRAVLAAVVPLIEADAGERIAAAIKVWEQSLFAYPDEPTIVGEVIRIARAVATDDGTHPEKENDHG